MKKSIVGTLLLLLPMLHQAQQIPCYRLYMMPGFGGDARTFSRLSLPGIDTLTLPYLLPEKGEDLPSYARRMAIHIDTSQPFSLLGVSFGGMLAVEMGKFLAPEQIILVASAKTRRELPFRYRFQRFIPIHRLLGGRFMIRLGPLGASIFEPQLRQDRDVFKSMLRRKDPRFMVRSLDCIVRWKNEQYPGNVVHIHGSKDHVLPLRKIRNAHVLPGGSHCMVYLRAQELSKFILSQIDHQ